MNVSNHAYERYCERFLNIEDCKEIKKYIVENKDKIFNSINDLYEDSKFIYHGKLGTDDISRFYLKDQIILVLNHTDDCIRTLYKIDFGFPANINQNVIDGLMEEIFKIQNELDQEVVRQQKDIDKNLLELENIQQEINAVEEKLKYLNAKKSVLNQDITCIKIRTNELEGILKKTAFQLCNSLEYRKEILKFAK